MNSVLTNAEASRIQANFDNTREAFALLALINAEFTSDPSSVACFDLRLVQRVAECVAKRREHDRRSWDMDP